MRMLKTKKQKNVDFTQETSHQWFVYFEGTPFISCREIRIPWEIPFVCVKIG